MRHRDRGLEADDQPDAAGLQPFAAPFVALPDVGALLIEDSETGEHVLALLLGGVAWHLSTTHTGRIAVLPMAVLGALVAVRQSDVSGWVLGVVRRLNKLSNEEVEAGVSLIAERVVAVTLHAKREVREGMGIVVNGFDASMLGPRIDGLYLPPPSRPDKPLVVKTVIVPTHEYAEGRKVILLFTDFTWAAALAPAVRPILRGSRCVPPAPGIRPSWTSGSPRIVFG